jgi:uncharacterized protein
MAGHSRVSMIDEQNPIRTSRITVARGIALLAVVFSTTLPRLRLQLDPFQVEPVVALAVLVAVLCLCGATHPALGLKLTSPQGTGYWLRVAGLFAAIIVALAAVAACVFYVAGWRVPVPRLDPQFVGHAAFNMCIYAPFVEETVFRSLLTFAVLPMLGERWTIIVSGVVFALVHILRGNPGPDNLVAGFMLQWAFLRSGSIVVPIAFHAGGNLIALSFHIAAWSALGPVG